MFNYTYSSVQLHPEGPLSNLKKLFLDGSLVNEVKQFLTQHWYIGLVAGLGFVIIIVSSHAVKPVISGHSKKDQKLVLRPFIA